MASPCDDIVNPSAHYLQQDKSNKCSNTHLHSAGYIGFLFPSIVVEQEMSNANFAARMTGALYEERLQGHTQEQQRLRRPIFFISNGIY